MTFQVSGLKKRQFLNLLNNKLNTIKPSYIKGSLQIKHFKYSNLLCARTTRAITNHVLIGKYHLRFFLKEDINCLYRSYLIETRCYILYDYRRFNKFWCPMRDMLSQVVAFLNSLFIKALHSKVVLFDSCFQLLNYFIFSFLLSFFFFLFSFHVVGPYVCSYKGATIDCHYTPYNKLLI